MNDKILIRKLGNTMIKYAVDMAWIVVLFVVSTVLGLLIPIFTKEIMDQGFVAGNLTLLAGLTALVFLIKLLDGAVSIIKEKKRVQIAGKIQKDLNMAAFDHLAKLNISYFCEKSKFEIINSICLDIENIITIADENVFFAITQLFSMAGGIIGLCIIDLKMTIVVLLFIPFKYFFAKHFAMIRKNVLQRYIDKDRLFVKWYDDTVSGMKEVRLFDLFHLKREELNDYIDGVIEEKKKIGIVNQKNSIMDVILLQTILSVLYIMGAVRLFRFDISLGSVFAFITYSSLVTSPISSLLNIKYYLYGIFPSAKRYFTFMELPEESENGEELGGIESIEFKNVEFSYENKQNLLRGVSFSIQTGDKIALTGANGSGKTTIINLLLGLYQVSGGTILINGKGMDYYSLSSIRKKIAVVSQEVYLFQDTLKNNICFNKNFDEKRLLQLLKDCALEEFADPDKWNYMVGPNGALLSGGQKQKVSLVRAIIQDTEVIIFDEATSNTDAYSNEKIEELFTTVLKKKTIIRITHKYEEVSRMNKILIIKDGKVIEN